MNDSKRLEMTIMNATTDTPVELPQEGSLDGSVDPSESNTSYRAATYLFLLVCLFITAFWLIYSCRNLNSTRIAGEQSESNNKKSLQECNEEVLQELERLETHTVLQEINFIKKRESQLGRNVENITREEKEEEYMTEIDLEEGCGDCITVEHSAVGGTDKKFVVPGTCAICLEDYSIGDTVVWSSNEQCNHIYHQFCIAEVFAHYRKKGKTCACPTCRREFITLENRSRETEEIETNDLRAPTTVARAMINIRQQQLFGVRLRL